MDATLRRSLAVALVLCAGLACSKARERDSDLAECVNWRDDVAPLLAEQCTGCHGAEAPAADYALTSYLGALGGGADAIDNALAGDEASRLVVALDPATADATHRGFADARSLLHTWVVDCDLSYFDSYVHTGGILNRHAGDFHGALVQASGYRFADCQGCHGEDFAGGRASVTCLTCHAEGPKACDTCHPASELPGAHATHLAGGALEKPVACLECHVVPASFEDAGHVFLADGTLDPSGAEVSLGALANRTLEPSWRSGPASYAAAQGSCGNVYCHGGALADTSAANREPVWSAVGTGQAECGTCHGLPPSTHQSDACFVCHERVVDAAGAIIDTALHLDGVVDVGPGGTLSCTSCHGSGDSPAPAPGLLGETSPSSVAVGAHASHLDASRLRGPVACEECHLVPATVSSAGHIDSAHPAEVFPEGAGDLARADGASPTWTRADATCGGSYCHGGGAGLATDTTPELLRVPVWTDTSGAAIACGTACHGTPPRDEVHGATLKRTQCTICHSTTVDAAGELRIIDTDGVRTSNHMNGVIDVR